jgi:hypothetical protein
MIGVLISLVLLTIFLLILGMILDKLLPAMTVDGSWKHIILAIVGLIALASILLGWGRGVVLF